MKRRTAVALILVPCLALVAAAPASAYWCSISHTGAGSAEGTCEDGFHLGPISGGTASHWVEEPAAATPDPIPSPTLSPDAVGGTPAAGEGPAAPQPVSSSSLASPLQDWSASTIFESLPGGPVWTGAGASVLGPQITCPDGWGTAVEVWADTGQQAVYCLRRVAQPMPTITVTADTDPLPGLVLGDALPGYSLTSGADPAAGAGLACPTGSGPAVTGNGYSYDRNAWTWSCIKSWVIAAPSPTSTDSASASATPDPSPSVAVTSANTDSTIDLLARDDVTVSLAVRSLSVGDRVNVKALRGTTVIRHWRTTVGRSGHIATVIPKSLRGSRIIISSRGRTVFNRIVR
ncbi:MAG: hypothetical protein NTX29_08195 [Actinobacteria bacterium]|nr:hypothetical protein [Actinomycetota bacterium]